LKIKKAISNNKLKVNYKLGTSGYGRVFPFKGLSLSCVRRQVRHSIAKVYYVDIDMENCQPAILKQLCDLNGQRCELLTYYCDNRKQCLKDVMDYYQVDRNAAKKLFLISQFGGKFNE
jgi:hypothetical protein